MKKKIILFLDVLGFKKFVCDYESHKIETIESVLNVIGETFSENIASSLFPKTRKTVTFFSDSVVISYDDTSDNNMNFAFLIEEISKQVIKCQIKLFEYGVLIRGGLTFGNIIHTNNKCFGTGLINAYILESKLAIYPRVLIDDEIIQFLKTRHDFEKIEKSFISKDENNIYFIDYAKQINNRQEAKNHFAGFRAFFNLPKSKQELSKNEIIEQLDLLIIKNSTEEKVKIKYSWLKDQFAKTNE
jgi:hypothetical protein